MITLAVFLGAFLGGAVAGALVLYSVLGDEFDDWLDTERERLRGPAPRPVGRRKVRTDRGDEGRWL